MYSLNLIFGGFISLVFEQEAITRFQPIVDAQLTVAMTDHIPLFAGCSLMFDLMWWLRSFSVLPDAYIYHFAVCTRTIHTAIIVLNAGRKWWNQRKIHKQKKAMQLWQHQWNLKTPTLFHNLPFYLGSYMRWMNAFNYPTNNSNSSNSSDKRQRTDATFNRKGKMRYDTVYCESWHIG